MDQHSHAQFFTRFEDREEALFVQIFIVYVRPNLYSFQTDLLAALQLLDRQFSVLHGKCTKTHILLGILIRDACNMVIEKTGKLKSIHRLRPIGKHDRDGANNLNLGLEGGVFS